MIADDRSAEQTPAREPLAPPVGNRLFLIDGYGVVYRMFFAMISRPLRTSHGENTSAVWGVANFISRLTAEYQPEFIAWVNDSGLSLRHERYPAYKATREKLSAELQADFDRNIERIEQLLMAYRIPVLEMEGYEADDVIGSLAVVGERAGLDVAIVSGDKDFHQMISPQVWLLNPGRGGRNGIKEQWIGQANRMERLGVEPSRVTDYLALVGDASDNVPGVRGIGEKTARILVNEYGDLETILRHAREIKQKRTRDALEECGAAARLSKELVTLQTDLPVKLDLELVQGRQPDYDALRRLYTELQFHSLVKGLASRTDVLGATESPNARARHAHHTVQRSDELTAIAGKWRAMGRVTIHLEMERQRSRSESLTSGTGALLGLGIGNEHTTWYLPLRHPSAGDADETALSRNAGGAESASGSEDEARDETLPGLTSAPMRAIREILEDGTIGKVGHDLKADLTILRREGVQLAGLEFDTMVAAYVLDPGRRSYGVGSLAAEFLDGGPAGADAGAGGGGEAGTGGEVTHGGIEETACGRVNTVARLERVFQEQLVAQESDALFGTIEMPLIPVLAEMEETGIKIDVALFRLLREQLASQQTGVAERIFEAAGERFNINSNAQLRRVLFEKLGLPSFRKTATGASTDSSVLERLAGEGHVLPSLIIEYREIAKLQATYVDVLLKLADPNTGRIHTSLNQTVAATGRLSSSEPNLQNIPIRGHLGREIRRGFVADDGWRLVSADYSQIELRLLAHLSEDVRFVNAFCEGGDIHRDTAAAVFGVSANEVTPEMRARAKTINFATLYGQGARALAQNLGIPRGEAERFIDEYFRRFNGVKQYLDSAVQWARTRGYAQTIFGRRRYIPELRDSNANIRAFGERTARNTPIQGSAADVIKIAMIRIAAGIVQRGMDARMLLQVHDELVFEVVVDEVESLKGLVRTEMERAADLRVPLVVHIGVGGNWLEAKDRVAD